MGLVCKAIAATQLLWPLAFWEIYKLKRTRTTPADDVPLDSVSWIDRDGQLRSR